jgi:cell division protein FtsL
MQIKDLLRFATKNWFKLAALTMAACGALYFTMIPLRETQIAKERAAGVAFEPEAMWRQQSLRGVLGGAVRKLASSNAEPVDYAPVQSAGLSATIPRTVADMAADIANMEERKILRNAWFDMEVKNPAEAADKIRQLAEHAGGFLETSQINGETDATSASLTIRVPAARFEEVRGEIRKLGLRVESEKLEAQDVTKQYVDQEARLRNLRAEEAQYLAILKHASTVSDTLEVSEKLGEVRGQIEQQQAEFETLTKQIETVGINVSLRAESDAQVLGLHWRPLYQLKLAFRDGLNGLANYAATMASVVFFLPALLLWLGTILLGLAVAYRILRWARRVLFPAPQPT